MKNKELEKLINDYTAIIERCYVLTKDLNNEQINWKPASDKWSIAECLNHLAITNNLYYKNAVSAVENAIEKNKTGDNPIKIGVIGKIFMGFEPPPKRRFKTPRIFSPRKDTVQVFTDEVIKKFVDSKIKMNELIKKSDGLDLNKVKISSPVTKMIKIRLGEYFSIMAPHDRRHLWQAENLKNHPDFPLV